MLKLEWQRGWDTDTRRHGVGAQEGLLCNQPLTLDH